MEKWNLIINVGRCENCYNCVIAAKDEHVGNDFPGYAAPVARDEANLIRIHRKTHGQAPMVDTVYLPVMCNHCDNAPCMRVGGDAIRKREDGIVIIDPIKAKGRKDIVTACPYKAIVWNEELQLPQTWIFDAHLLDQGWKVPRCQQSCPTGVFEAIKVSDKEMARRALADDLQVLLPKLEAKPRVYYRNLKRYDHCFIGGSVSSSDGTYVDCVEGAEVILTQAGQVLQRTVTDHFGDFRFTALASGSGSYRTEISHAKGKAARECELGESTYLGEIRIN